MAIGSRYLPPHLVAGLAIGVKGVRQRIANFAVRDVCVRGIPPQPVRIPACVRPTTGPHYPALLSGLSVVGPRLDSQCFRVLVDFLCGRRAALTPA